MDKECSHCNPKKRNFLCQLEFSESEIRFLIELQKQIPELNTIADAVRFCIKKEQEKS